MFALLARISFHSSHKRAVRGTLLFCTVLVYR